MKKLSWIVAVLLGLALVPAGARAQASGTITGLVTAEDTQQPLAGVQVFIVGSNRGTLSDQRGRFLLTNVEPGSRTLRATRIGYREATQEVEVGTGTVEVNFTLGLDPLGLDELVVIGYGRERRSNVAGAVSSINTEALEDIQTASVDQALQGRLPGVQVVQNSGDPGSAISVRVRGASSISAGNQPLYVIDGVPVTADPVDEGAFSSTTGFNAEFGGQETSPLANLNPNDIASIEVLKDASAAAIYGSRASNGVVLITTKRGIPGETQINFSGYYGVQRAWNTVDYLNTEQYIDLYNESYGDGFIGYTDDGEENYWEVIPGTDTDWVDEVLAPAPVRNFTLSASGGNEQTRYFVSGDVFDQDAIVGGFGYQRFSGRLNLDYGAGERLDLGTNLTVSHSVDRRAASDNTIYGPFSNATANPPWQTVYEEDGSYTETLYANPVGLLNENEAQERSVRILGNAFAEYALTEGLRLRGGLGVDQLNLNGRRYYSPIVGSAVGSNGEGEEATGSVSRVTWEGTLSYDELFGDVHSLTGVIGTSYEDNTTETSSVTGSQFPTEYFRYLTSAASITGGTSTLTDWSLISYFGRASYTFDDRYTATFNIRADGSSRFGEDNRYGVFPSAALLWRLADEDFMQGQGLFDDLRLRASYGLTGNQGLIDDFASRGLFEGGANYNDVPGIAPFQLANPELRWETTRQFDVGTDFAVLDNRLSFTADYYIKTTDDLLVNRPIPLTTGFASITSNVGAIENRGIELGITADLVRGGQGGFSWTSQFNITRNENEVTSLLNDEPLNYGFVSRVEVGEELGAFYGYQTDGIFRNEAEVEAHAFQTNNTAPGDVRFRDLNGDGRITAEDRTIIGSPWPDFSGGWNNDIRFRGFDLTLFTQFSQGNEIYNGNRLYSEAYGRFGDATTTRALQRWTPENPNGTEPRATAGDPNDNDRSSDRFVEDGSYIRLKNAVLGYTFPQTMSSRWGFDNMRLYVQGQNLLTFTDYSGFDPEVNYAGGSAVVMGTDFYTLPQPRTLSIGIQLGM